VLRKEDNDWVKKCTEYEVEGSRPRGRPKRTWRVVQKDCQALPILVKICPTIIEILAFNKWSLKFNVSRSMLSYLRFMELTDVSIEATVALAKQKQTKWCLVPKIWF